MAADRRRLAPAAASAQRASGSGRRMVPIGRVGRRDLDRRFAIAAGAIAWIVLALTGSVAAAVAAAAVFALNPNVLYLQSTPMTEPLLMGADDAGGGDADRLVHGVGRVRWTRLTLRSPGGSQVPPYSTIGVGVRAGLPDALRSVACDGGGAGRRCMGPAGGRAITRRRGCAASARSPLFPVVGDRGLSRLQPRRHRPVVCRERVLRAGKQGARRSTDGGRRRSGSACTA